MPFETSFGQPRPILVLTDSDRAAAAVLAALDQLIWPAQRARTLDEAAALGETCTWELILCDVRLQRQVDGRGQLPAVVRGAFNRDTPWLPMGRVEDEPTNPGGVDARPAGVLYPEAGSPFTLAELIAAELEQAAEGRLLTSARLLVGAFAPPAVALPALEVPPALAAAHQLDWLYHHSPSLEQAAEVVSQQENLAKQVLRLARTLSGDLGARSWTLDRVLLDLGLQRFIPLVKIIAARMMFPVRDPGRAHSLTAIWRFSVARALAMRALASRSHPVVRTGLDWQHAFDAGLFADAGAGLLIWLQDQSQPRRSRLPSLHVVPSRLAPCHEWLGERLLDRWQHPRPVWVVAGGHHGSASLDPGGMRALAFAAAVVVEEAGVGPDPTGSIDRIEATFALERLSVDAGTRGQVAAQVRVELARIEEGLAG